MVGAYHLVCHECPFEGLFDDRATAERERAAHESTTDHQTTLLDISEPEPAGTPGPS
ncbi:hypothetical protein [Haloarcula salina]|uniref:Uncharacterized protein n=1 Tax=Haloarcula salina TaxID=1429914 RepID=A0AA41FZ23_9EURY|nr:hypothetical protein [Haloarcula salina]MBV0900539.1 hypothetical protein [Haloarcula salina]